MATKQNKLIPVLGIVAVAIVGTIVWKNMSGPSRPAAGPMMTKAPQPELPATKGADRDTPQETLETVIASNRELRASAEKVIKDNEALRRELEEDRERRARQPYASAQPGAAAPRVASNAAVSLEAPQPSAASREGGVVDVLSQAFDRASDTAGKLMNDPPSVGRREPAGTGSVASAYPGAPAAGPGQVGAGGEDGARQWSRPAEGVVAYKVMPPMGYALQVNQQTGRGGVATGSYVRTTVPPGAGGAVGGRTAAVGPATRAAEAAAKATPVPYFTIPENATLAGVVSMTSLIGRVPIDGRVTDPMQWKGVVGRDNLAANGFELPDDLAGVIVSGIAIGDMALSCTEGKVRSLTFVFNDGTINTVSTRRSGGGGGGQIRTSTGGSGDLGYISDLHGNPCIMGKFVTNAPAYLTDIVGMSVLEVAGQAYSDAQRTVTQSAMTGTTSSAITGSMGSYVLGQAVSGASDEVSKWLLSRLKNSFDAVVSPSGQRLVVHLDTEVRIDKNPQGRRLVHRQQNALLNSRGAHHGLE